MLRKAAAIAAVVLFLQWAVPLILPSAEVAAVERTFQGSTKPAGTVDGYLWSGPVLCGTTDISITYTITVQPGGKFIGRWESEHQGVGSYVRYAIPVDGQATTFNVGPGNAAGARFHLVAYQTRMAYHVYADDTDPAFPNRGTFEVTAARVTMTVNENDPHCAPLQPTPIPSGEPGGGTTPTLPPQPTDPPWVNPTPSPQPSGEPTPTPGPICILPLPSGYAGPPPVVDCDTPGAIDISTGLPVPTPTPSPTPSPPAPTCVDLNTDQPVQLRLNASPLVAWTGEGLAGLPICKYPIGPTGAPQWDWQVRVVFTRTGYQNLGSGSLTSFQWTWLHGYFATPPEGGATSLSGSSGVTAHTFTGVDTMVNGNATYGGWSDYNPATQHDTGASPRYIWPTATIGGSCSGTCDIVTGTVRLEWQQPGGLPTPSPEPSATPSPTPTPTPDPNATPSPTVGPFDPGTSPTPIGQPSDVNGGGMSSGAWGPSTGLGNGTGIGECIAQYPKPGQIKPITWTAVQVPPGSVNPLDYAAVILDYIGHLPDAIVNVAIGWWNLLVDAVVPSNCVVLLFNQTIDALKLRVPFNWIDGAATAITGAFADAEGVPAANSLTLFGESYGLGGMLGSGSAMLDQVSQFRPIFVGLLYLRFAMWLWAEALAWAGRRHPAPEDDA